MAHADHQNLLVLLDKIRQHEREINNILARHPASNKAVAKSDILGLCAQCGKQKTDEEGYYCRACRKRLRQWQQRRYVVRKSQGTVSVDLVYSCDDH